MKVKKTKKKKLQIQSWPFVFVLYRLYFSIFICSLPLRLDATHCAHIRKKAFPSVSSLCAFFPSFLSPPVPHALF